MSSTVHEVLTLEQFLKLPEIKPPLEFPRGRVEQKAPRDLPQAVLSSELMMRIDAHARPAGMGRAFPMLRCNYGGESFVFDVCAFARGRLPKDRRGRYAEQALLAPELAIEILPFGQAVAKLSARLARCVRKGVRLAWLIQPRRSRVFVFRPDQPHQTLELGDVLSGDDLLPGFVLPLEELFGWLVEED